MHAFHIALENHFMRRPTCCQTAEIRTCMIHTLNVLSFVLYTHACTSHCIRKLTMDCDAAIMASGRLKCIGTALHLKNAYGDGYRLNLVTEPERSADLQAVVSRLLPGMFSMCFIFSLFVIWFFFRFFL